MMICEQCANRENCEYAPYSVECDTAYKNTEATAPETKDEN